MPCQGRPGEWSSPFTRDGADATRRSLTSAAQDRLALPGHGRTPKGPGVAATVNHTGRAQPGGLFHVRGVLVAVHFHHEDKRARSAPPAPMKSRESNSVKCARSGSSRPGCRSQSAKRRERWRRGIGIGPGDAASMCLPARSCVPPAPLDPSRYARRRSIISLARGGHDERSMCLGAGDTPMAAVTA
jgi:hypothetical protein